jgi:hypothetical protein
MNETEIAQQSRRALLKQVGGTVAWLAVPRLCFAAEQRDVPWLAEVQQ